MRRLYSWERARMVVVCALGAHPHEDNGCCRSESGRVRTRHRGNASGVDLNRTFPNGPAGDARAVASIRRFIPTYDLVPPGDRGGSERSRFAAQDGYARVRWPSGARRVAEHGLERELRRRDCLGECAVADPLNRARCLASRRRAERRSLSARVAFTAPASASRALPRPWTNATASGSASTSRRARAE